MDLRNLFNLSSKGWLSGGEETRCGGGSTIESTKEIREQLPELIDALYIETILDIGCGDLNWIHDVIPGNVEYTGIDWVLKQDALNRKKPNMRLIDGNIFENNITKYDLIICKDVMIHFDLETALDLYNMILESGSGYLLATTYDNDNNYGNDASVYWKINLDIEPFGKMAKSVCYDRENDELLRLYKI